MASLRDKLRKRTTTRPEVDMEDLGYLTDPQLPSLTKDRYGMAEKLKAKQHSLRRRFVLGLDLCEEKQDPQPSLIRKGINSLSSSLRDRFSSDTSTDSEGQGRRPSVIRKSISSMSSSLRGIRSSISSRPSQDGSTEYHTSPENTGKLVNFQGIPRRNSLGHISSTSSGQDSVPRLPALDTMVANIKLEEMFTGDRSPNTVFNMSIFDSLDRPYMANPSDKATTGQEEPIAKQPSPIPERFPVRIKRPDPAVAERTAGPRVSQEDVPTIASDQGSTDCPAQNSVKLNGTPTNWKVPMHRIERILETSVTMREQGYQLYKPVPDCEIRERIRRLETRVYVFIPDESDNSKPWPRRCYSDLETALKDLCARFKPYYASFAAFTPEARTIQLFPSNFRLPQGMGLIPGTIIFNIQEAVDNWYVGSPIDGPGEEEEETKESMTTQTTRTDSSISTEPEIYTMQEYKRPYVYDTDKASLDDGIREPGISAFAKHKLGSSEESLLTDDYDMTIASKMGFIP
ncbi:hypothetical protein F4813DRAFT_382273 [Daldinia decipiens]|uniref:uncharacterized protein n=1 Tax=Daldinia decipiens TaxID=326647 RepID=UPI0020C2EBE4|nr:uncharacterized protein F4813DRAFT_382273 [Daldinia decipiens]KAI1655079.1 hypothetical protein F4813DRAFT_382273 [Daldinia decipiens]